MSNLIGSQRVGVRFLATLSANVIRTALAVVSGLVTAHALGAAEFGNLNFLLAGFAAINLVLDMGTSSAFYTLISRRPRGARFFGIYLLWTIVVQFLGTLILIGLVMPKSVVDRIWLGQDRAVVLLAFAATFITSQIWTMVSQMGEALRNTIFVQAAAAFQALLHLALVAGAARLGILSVPVVLGLTIGEYLFVCVVVAPVLYGRSVAQEDAQSSRDIAREFLLYCGPLLIYGMVGFFYQFADRWLLQKFGGAREQGFFSLGQQFAALTLLATTSILQVLWKEVAEARERGDVRAADQFFGKVRRALFFFAAWLSCMIVPYSGEIVSMSVGSDFRGAFLPTALMLLFPIQQTLGQIQGTYLLATGNTRTHSRIGIVTMLLSLPATYAVLAPASSTVPGLGLGAVGLAVKMLLLQFIGVALQIRALARLGSVSYDFVYQLGVTGVFLLLSFGVRWLTSFALQSFYVPLVVFIAVGCATYAAISTLALLRFPSLAGVDPSILRNLGTPQDQPAR